MTIMTKRRKQLMQEHKSNLVDMVYLLEHKLEKAVEEVQFLKNEMLLCQEANIAAQQELDGNKKPETMTKEQNKKFHDDLNDMIIKADEKKLKDISNTKKMEDIEKCLDGAWEGEITSDNFVETVTQIFTGDYYDKIKEKSTSNE